MRPGSESAILGSVSTFAEPVSKYRPGRRSASTRFFIGKKSSGARCTSSIKHSVPASSKKASGPAWPHPRSQGHPKSKMASALARTIHARQRRSRFFKSAGMREEDWTKSRAAFGSVFFQSPKMRWMELLRLAGSVILEAHWAALAGFDLAIWALKAIVAVSRV